MTKGQIALLAGFAALAPLTIDMYLPMLTPLAHDLGASVEQAGASVSVFLIGIAGGQLVAGPLSDRFGRRPLILSGLVLFALSAAAAGLTGSFAVLLAARLLQVLGACSAMVVGRAVVRDHPSDCPHPHDTFARAGENAQSFFRARDVVQDGPSERHERLACLCQPHAERMPLEQNYAAAALELPDQSAERRLRQMQFLSRSSDAAKLRHPKESAERAMIKPHAKTLWPVAHFATPECNLRMPRCLSKKAGEELWTIERGSSGHVIAKPPRLGDALLGAWGAIPVSGSAARAGLPMRSLATRRPDAVRAVAGDLAETLRLHTRRSGFGAHPSPQGLIGRGRGLAKELDENRCSTFSI